MTKHPCVQEILQVELNARVTRLSESYFPELYTANDDPRIKFIFAEAGRWFQACSPGFTDLVIVDSQNHH